MTVGHSAPMQTLTCSACDVAMIAHGEHGPVERIPRDDDPMSRYGVIEYIFECPTCDAAGRDALGPESTPLPRGSAAEYQSAVRAFAPMLVRCRHARLHAARRFDMLPR